MRPVTSHAGQGCTGFQSGVIKFASPEASLEEGLLKDHAATFCTVFCVQTASEKAFVTL